MHLNKLKILTKKIIVYILLDEMLQNKGEIKKYYYLLNMLIYILFTK